MTSPMPAAATSTAAPRVPLVVGADIVKARGGRMVTPLFGPNASTTSIVDRIRLSRTDG